MANSYPKVKWDGHTHSEYCPHANIKQTLLMVEKAIDLGFEKYSITEHAPLPTKLLALPDTPKDSSMAQNKLIDYLSHLQGIKKYYSSKIKILIGLEIDYLLGMEEFTEDLFADNESFLDEVVYSLHFLPNAKGELKLLDKSLDGIKFFFPTYSAEKLWEVYFQTMQQMLSISWNFAKPIRLGHLLLIEKYHKKNPISSNIYKKWIDFIIEKILPLVSQRGYSLDWNVAGLRKSYCQKIYWHSALTEKTKQLGIPLVYGSDAHSLEEVGLDFYLWENFLKKAEYQ